jgi:serine/threonine-protein kinase RsbW
MATGIMPADKDYLALARTSTMQIAALLDLSMSRVTDLRLAVDEACTSFLVAAGEAGAPSGDVGNLELYYDRYPEQLHVTVCGNASAGWPTRDELGWEMLRALVGEVRAEIVAGTGVLTLIEPLPEVEAPE